MIRVDIKSKAFGRTQVLKDVAFMLKPGECLAILGKSGVGKSTLLRLIYERIGNAAALVPQELGLVQALTVFHNVYMGRLNERSLWRNLRNLVMPAASDVAEVKQILERLRLEEKLFASVGELSGGQQQRTAVGRALYHSGDILIADEPVSSVDEHQARDILDVVNSAKRSVVLAMHDRALAIAYADRLVGIKGGQIVLDERSAGMKPSDLDDLYLNGSA